MTKAGQSDIMLPELITIHELAQLGWVKDSDSQALIGQLLANQIQTAQLVEY